MVSLSVCALPLQENVGITSRLLTGRPSDSCPLAGLLSLLWTKIVNNSNFTKKNLILWIKIKQSVNCNELFVSPPAGNLWYRQGVTPSYPQGSAWELISSNATKVSVGPLDQVRPQQIKRSSGFLVNASNSSMVKMINDAAALPPPRCGS